MTFTFPLVPPVMAMCLILAVMAGCESSLPPPANVRPPQATSRPAHSSAIPAKDGEVALEKQSLRELLFLFRHHLIMGEYDEATVYIKAILARKPEPAELIKAIEDDPQQVLNLRDTGLVPLLERIVRSDKTPRDLKTAASSLLDFFY
jgi:hypothetical protein